MTTIWCRDKTLSYTSSDLQETSRMALLAKRQRHFVPRTLFVLAMFSVSWLFLSSDRSDPADSSVRWSHRTLLSNTPEYDTVSDENAKTEAQTSEGDDPSKPWCKAKNASEEGDEDNMFPTDAFTKEQQRHGAIILHIIGIIYMFYALALVCDEFFVPSLEVIIEKLGVSPDVAGATFMAAGGSAPELFTSVIGVFIAQNDVGIGTIVGSAVFNILFVIAFCAFAAEKALSLTAWPLIRDVFFYAVSLAFLVGFFMDNQIMWYEALILFLWYFAYVGFMKFNEPVEDKLRELFKLPPINREGMERGNPLRTTLYRKGLYHLMNETINPGIIKNKRNSDKDGQACETEMTPLKSEGIMIGHQQAAGINALKTTLQAPDASGETAVSAGPTQENGKEMEEVPKVVNPAMETTGAENGGNSGGVGDNNGSSEANAMENGTGNGAKESGGDGEEGEEEEAEPIDMSFPKDQGWKKILVYLVSLPLMGPLFLTLPDTKNEKKKKFFAITFVGSILWIALYSYLMVWWATVTGKCFGISDVVMGLTFLAAGTSVPDLITSVLVAKQGKGDMAVSSSVGSNIFDVTVGLPVPWLLWCLVNGKAHPVSSEGIGCSISLLFLMLILVFLSIVGFKWKMTKPMGGVMLILYVIFVIISIGLDSTVCWFPCPINFN